MGRWAQAKRRGTATVVPAGIPVPEVPALDIVDERLLQAAQGGDDTGGQCLLYYSADYGGPYNLVDTASWAADQDWGGTGELTPGYYRCTEYGNGTSYAGESAQSLIVSVGA